MSRYTPINGFTKASIIERIEKEFKGKAMRKQYEQDSACVYLSKDGKKCAVGLFLPDGHVAQESTETAHELLREYPELKGMMPLDSVALSYFQSAHDNLDENLAAFDQKELLIAWVKENVKDTATEVGA